MRNGGTEIVSAGGIASDTNVSSGGALVVSSGGVADPTTIFSGGTETVRAGGTDDGARISSGGKLFIQSGGTAVDITIFSGGSAINSAGGKLDVVGSATDFGVLVNSGTINVRNGATLTLGAATLNNAGSINLLGSTSQTTLFIAHNVTLSGGGTVSMSGVNSLITDNGGGFTLTNVNDKIVGVGGLGGELSLFVVNEAGGVIDGNGSGRPTGNTCDGNKRRIDRGDDLGGACHRRGRPHHELRDDRGAGHRRIGANPGTSPSRTPRPRL